MDKNTDVQSLIRQRLGLVTPSVPKEVEDNKETDNEKNKETPICDGCNKCFEFSPGGAGGKCATCDCAMICHIRCADDEDLDFSDDQYESEFGGGEDW